MINKKMMQYSSYKEISDTVKHFMITVANVKFITELSIAEINEFLNDYENYLDNRIEM